MERMVLVIMKIEEIKKEEKEFKPISITLTLESLNEIKSLLAYLNLPEEIVKKYYYDFPNKYYPEYPDNKFISIKIDKIKRIDNLTLTSLNNIALSSEKII